MTRIGTAIIEEAEQWAARSCRETVANGGSCIDDLQAAYSGGVVNREAYCAKFAWVVVEAACSRVGIRNLLPKTASAVNMRDRSRQSMLPTNQIPAPGSVFYRYSTAPGASGHIGVVVGWDSRVMYTIEGNRSDRIDAFENRWSTITRQNGWEFIHTEQMPGGTGSPVTIAGLSPSARWVAAVWATIGIYELMGRGISNG